MKGRQTGEKQGKPWTKEGGGFRRKPGTLSFWGKGTDSRKGTEKPPLSAIRKRQVGVPINQL